MCLVIAAEGDTALSDEHNNEVICRPGLGFCRDPQSKPGNVETQPRVKVYPPAQGYFPMP